MSETDSSKKTCAGCRHFSGLIKRIDPILLQMKQNHVQLSNINRDVRDRISTINIEECMNKGGVCMRFPATGKNRPVIWDGDDYCAEWEMKV